MGQERRARAPGQEYATLHGNAVASSASGGVRVLTLADGAPDRGHEVVAGALAVVNQADQEKEEGSE